MTLYTRTVCGKCMFVKSQIKSLGLEESCKVINMDENPEAKERVKEAGFMTAPVLEIDGELIGNDGLIMQRLAELEG